MNMPHTDLRSFLADLGDDLVRVSAPLDPRHEIAALLRALPAEGPAVLIENVSGYPGARVVGNLLASRRRMARALGSSEAELARTWIERTRHGIPTQLVGKAPAQELVHRDPDDVGALLPMLTHHENDGGPFITTGVVLCRDPLTGQRGMGIHRMMFKGGRRFGIFLANPPLSRFHANAEATGRPLEIAVVLGLEPAIVVASVVKTGPLGPDKMEIAGALRGGPVAMTRAVSVDLEVPARAEIVIEGHVLPGLREVEGPFGENTGYYFSNTSPVVEVRTVTHRRDFIYPALCPWTGDVDTLLSLAAGSELLGQLQAQVAGVVDLDLTAGTCGFAAVIGTRGVKPAEVRRLIYLALTLDRRLKMVTIVDDDVDIRNSREVAWAVATRFQPDRDVVVLPAMEGYVIDPSSSGSGSGSKMGLDATRGAGTEFDRIRVTAAAAGRAEQVLGELFGQGRTT